MMETNERFESLKSEILRRAKKTQVCAPEYARAYRTETVSDLMRVIKDNFSFACKKRIIDSELIAQYGSEFSENEIYCNVSVEKGYLLACDDAVIEHCSNCIADVRDNATVQDVRDNATVQNVWGNAYISSYTTIECKLSNNAIHRIRETNTIRYAEGDLKFEKRES
jgi:hypothetical protein